jgi:hypothetical protein
MRTQLLVGIGLIVFGSVGLVACDNGSASPTNSNVFESPLYGYSIALPVGWIPHAATLVADDPNSTDETAADEIPVPSTDTQISAYALDLGDQTFMEWATEFHEDTALAVPSGCSGGDPSTWPTLPVGDAQGYLIVKCNEVVVAVPIGVRVYEFVWGNSTFDSAQHLPRADFETLMQGVTLPDEATNATPLFVPPSSP